MSAIVSAVYKSDLSRHNLLDLFLLRYDRAQTKRAYRNDLVQFFGTEHITLDLAKEVTFIQVNTYVEALEADGRKPSTLRRRISAIRKFYDWLKALQVIDYNPADSTVVRRVPKGQDAPMVVLTARQVRQLLDATELAGEASARNRAMILTTLLLVLRRSEVAAMDTRHLRMNGAFWVLDLPMTKGGVDQWVKVPDHLVDEIKRYQHIFGIVEGPLWISLSNRNLHQRLHPDSIYRIVKQTAIQAGLEAEIGAHTLRHTGCTLALDNGATLEQIQAHARHKNIQTTMGYIRQRDKLRDSAADYIKF